MVMVILILIIITSLSLCMILDFDPPVDLLIVIYMVFLMLLQLLLLFSISLLLFSPLLRRHRMILMKSPNLSLSAPPVTLAKVVITDCQRDDTSRPVLHIFYK